MNSPGLPGAAGDAAWKEPAKTATQTRVSVALKGKSPKIDESYYNGGPIAARGGFLYASCVRKLSLPIPMVLMVLLALTSLVWAGAPDLKTYFASDFTDQAYQKKVHQKVGISWKRPSEPPKAGSKAVVIATILRDGSLLETKLHMKSGSDAWDASALEALKRAAPLDPLPKGYPRTSVEVHFHFEYN